MHVDNEDFIMKIKSFEKVASATIQFLLAIEKKLELDFSHISKLAHSWTGFVDIFQATTKKHCKPLIPLLFSALELYDYIHISQ